MTLSVTPLLRIASIATLLYAAGHTSGMPWLSPPSEQTSALAHDLRSHNFDVMGANRTVWDFHLGFGLIISLDLLILAVVLWQLATLARSAPALTRPLLATYAVAFLGNALLAGRYFFVVPTVMALFICLCLALAFVAARPGPALSSAPSRA